MKLNTKNEQIQQQESSDLAEIDGLGETEDSDGHEKPDDLRKEEEYDSENSKMDDFKDHQRHYRHHSFENSDSVERHNTPKRNSGKRRHRSNQRDKWPVIDEIRPT